MEAQVVKITGPGGAPYQLGQPMLMFAGQIFLGCLDPVRVSNDGAEVHFGAFSATAVVNDEPRNVGALLLYEACAHVAHTYPQVQVIGFALSRPMPTQGEPSLQAATRVAAAEYIGTTNIEVRPTPSGGITVSGEWIYNEQNLRALESALDEYRAMFRTVPIGRGRRWPPWLRRLRRLMMRRRAVR